MTTYSTTLQQAGWVAYINGLEVPFVSAQMTWEVWAKPRLQLQLFPFRKLQRLGFEDRLQVVLFYLDNHYDPDNPTLRLLGEFEVKGYTYTNNTRNRSVTLNCEGHVSIFEQLYFFYMSSLVDMAEGLSATRSQSPETVTQAKPLYPASLFRDGLINKDEGDLIKRPTDFVTNIFRALLWPVGEETELGGQLPAEATAIPGKNFFARWLNMCRFHRRWASLPLLEDNPDDSCFPLLKAVQDTTALSALQQQIGSSIGSSGTAWDLLRKVLGYMYMEVTPIPAPPAVPVRKGTGKVQPHEPSPKYGSELFTSILSYTVKPQCFFGLPPLCNVIFPSMVKNFSYQENYAQQPTRTYIGEAYVANLITSAKTGVDTLTKQLLTTAYPPAVRKKLHQAISGEKVNSKNFLLYPEEFFKGPQTQRTNAPPWLYLLSQQYKGSESAEEVSNAREGALGTLFDKYAEYEHFRTRYASRVGGVSMLFNPYVVPGYACMVFDREAEGFHSLGYVQSVSHTCTAGTGGGAMSTEVNVGFMRTLHESVQQLHDEESASHGFDISPPEPIEEVRDIFQKRDRANEFFNALLHRGAPKSGASVFAWRELVEFVEPDGATVSPYADPIYITDDVKVVPKDNVARLFEDANRALQFVARPACTLREYVEEYHGKPIEELLEQGVVRGPVKAFHSDVKDAKKEQGAVFYGRIYDLVEGPGEPPGEEVTAVGDEEADFIPKSEQWTMASPETGVAQTRENWSKVLEEYRKIVRKEYGKTGIEE